MNRASPLQYVERMTPEQRLECGIEAFDTCRARGEQKREADILKQCEQWLTLHGVCYLHLSPKAREKKGWPDLVFCWRCVPWAIEIKTPTGRTTPDQDDILLALRGDGWHVAVCRSLPDLIDAVTQAGHPRPLCAEE